MLLLHVIVIICYAIIEIRRDTYKFCTLNFMLVVKHFLERVYSKHNVLKKMCQPTMTLNTLTVIFFFLNLVKILLHAPNAELCASLTGNSTTFGTLEVIPWQSTFLSGAWLDLGLLLVLSESWLVCLPS